MTIFDPTLRIGFVGTDRVWADSLKHLGWSVDHLNQHADLASYAVILWDLQHSPLPQYLPQDLGTRPALALVNPSNNAACRIWLESGASDMIEVPCSLLGLQQHIRQVLEVTDQLTRRVRHAWEMRTEIERHLPFLAGSSPRLADAVWKLAGAAGYSLADCQVLVVGALVSSQPLLQVDAQEFLREGPLSASFATDLVRGYATRRAPLWLAGLPKACEIWEQRHWRWDGQLSPQRPSSVASLVAVADTYIALTSPRPFRTPVSQHQAMEEISRCAGSQFDPVMVSLLRSTLETTLAMGQPAAADLGSWGERAGLVLVESLVRVA